MLNHNLLKLSLVGLYAIIEDYPVEYDFAYRKLLFGLCLQFLDCSVEAKLVEIALQRLGQYSCGNANQEKNFWKKCFTRAGQSQDYKSSEESVGKCARVWYESFRANYIFS